MTVALASSRSRAVDWASVEQSLDAQGFTRLPPLLNADECDSLARMYQDESRFRSRIEMERFRFGVGEYKYFGAPLPPIVEELREHLYERLAPVANRWALRLRSRPPADGDGKRPYPDTLSAYLRACHTAGQRRPTPLLLSYGAGGYNCLHQDIYGELAFPLQVVCMLSRRDKDYTGGEFLLVEQRPRAQSRGHAVAIDQGAGVIFATRERPVEGSRGWYRTVMRHGVSTVTSGSRMTLGIIFHDAK